MADNTLNADYGYIDFDADGEWDEKELEGPAVLAPKHIRNLVVTEYRIEWVSLGYPGEFVKNHLVAAATFANPINHDGRTYYAARLSMDTAEDGGAESAKRVRGADSEAYEPGVDYWIGAYQLALRRYAGPTAAKAHYRTFELKQGTTIGNLIDKVVKKKMHHFCFYPYQKPGEPETNWRGCRDHVLHCWAVLVREGIITSEKSKEKPSTPLWKELNVTYYQKEVGGPFIPSPMKIEPGWWVFRKPTWDNHTPDEAYSERKPAI